MKFTEARQNMCKLCLYNYTCIMYSTAKPRGAAVAEWLSSWLAEQEAGVRFPTSPLEFQGLVISCFQVATWLKYHWSDVNSQYNQPSSLASVLQGKWNCKWNIQRPNSKMIHKNHTALAYLGYCIFSCCTTMLELKTFNEKKPHCHKLGVFNRLSDSILPI